MKPFAFLLALLGSGTLLTASCTNDKAADSAATTATTSPNAAPSGDMAGMDHSTMHHGAAAPGDSPLLTSMNEMMRKMEATTPKGNTDHDFARHMLEHHRGAVAMADIELRDGQDATMRQLAANIKADQQREIAELEAVAARLAGAPTNYNPQDATDPFTRQMQASMDDMMKNMPEAVADPDMNFNLLMTVHHQSAVDMAKAEVAHGRDPKLKAMAQRMIDAQQREIQQFKNWRTQNASKM